MKSISLAISYIFCFMAFQNAYAGSSSNIKLTIDMHNEEFHRFSEVDLKEKLKDLNHNFNFFSHKLEAIHIYVKSNNGRSGVRLIADRQTTPFFKVKGDITAFEDNSPRTFNRLIIKNQSKLNQGPWKINLKGTVIIRKIDLILSKVDRTIISESIQCESNDTQVVKCKSRGEVLDAKVDRRISSGFCVKDLNWGFNKNHIWVSRGCKAIFNLNIKDN